MADVLVFYSRAKRRGVWWAKHLLSSDDYSMLIEFEIDAARRLVIAWSPSRR